MLAPKDPLRDTGPVSQEELFDRLAAVCHGFPAEAVHGAAVNLLINSLRQTYPTWDKCEIAFDEVFGQGKSILSNHYDSLGRKRGIFPYTQNIAMQHFNSKSSFKGSK